MPFLGRTLDRGPTNSARFQYPEWHFGDQGSASGGNLEISNRLNNLEEVILKKFSTKYILQTWQIALAMEEY